ncbi:rab proteins geranylgeranyltransferase component A 1 [Diabrotica virgifera virgifera]|uniref:Rab proteins geranylgeranyltransferase component A n=1 Tax=Diabrotica virgifera virgifera TaxID=50390 RepID=A0ABM5IWR0_DIAVI|nr:rab proteins geranylgeranyltransferase component A 1 [Diabrotica virgifera virgifera]
MDYEFPTDFDIVIVGTGIIESIISAAASRVGKRVLHVDEKEYYGGHWASFSLEAILELKKSKEYPVANVENPDLCLFGNQTYDLKNVDYKFHVIPKENTQLEKQEDSENQENIQLEKQEDSENQEQVTECKDNDENEQVIEKEKPDTDVWDKGALLKLSRKFNIDLTPKLQYARGHFVELLISSNIARYSEYRSVSRILTWYNKKLDFLPCSRSDVFANSKVSVVEKRMLMKVLTALNTVDKLNEYENKTFKQYLTDQKLTPNLIHYLLYGISMSSDDTPCDVGVVNVKRFLDSLGRFGHTPFLYSMYGSGEIPQAFCRLSAVFGGVFALGQNIQGFTVSDNKFKSITVRSQNIQAEHLVMSIEKVPKQFLKSNTQQYISRCVLITDKSILDSEKEHLTLAFYPPENGKPFVKIIELGCLTGTCLKPLYLVHLLAKQGTTPQEDFSSVIDSLFGQNEETNMENENEQKPSILWSMYFSLPDTNDGDLTEGLPENVFVCPGPDADLDYDYSVKKAEEMFRQIYADLDFLPRAPDPEEIVIGEEEGQEETAEGDAASP